MDFQRIRFFTFGAVLSLAGVLLFHSTQFGPTSDPHEWTSWASSTNLYTTPNWPAPIGHAAPGESPSFVHAAEASVNAVVHVETASIVPDQSNPWLSMLGVVAGRIAQGSGSGVVLEEDGWIVTNHHVIEGAREVRVNTSDGHTYEAEIVGSDPSTDLALLKVTPQQKLPTLSFGNSDNVRVGQWVLAVGNPLNLTSTVTAGIISAKGRNIHLLKPDVAKELYPVESFLQTDAAVNPGNSGGALVNLEGELVGINTAIASQTGSYSGYSFAIPASIVSKVVRDLKEFGRVQRAFLGITVDTKSAGIKVTSAHPGGGAYEAGIQANDRILSVNGLDVSSFPALQEQLSKHRPGDVVALSIQREGRKFEIKVKLTDRHGETSLDSGDVPNSPSAASIPSRNPSNPHSNVPERRDVSEVDWAKSWGVKLEDLAPATCEKLNLRGGVVAVEVSDGEWQNQGLKSGFILTRMDGAPVHTLEDVNRALIRAHSAGESGMLLEGMYPNGKRAYAGVSVPNSALQSHE